MTTPATIIFGIIQGVQFVVLLWCLLSWFPNIRWHEQPFRTLDQIVNPIVAPFRKLIPPLGGIDLSPMIAMFTLQLIAMAIAQVLY